MILKSNYVFRKQKGNSGHEVESFSTKQLTNSPIPKDRGFLAVFGKMFARSSCLVAKYKTSKTI